MLATKMAKTVTIILKLSPTHFVYIIDPDLKLLKAILSQFVINLGSQKLDLKNEQGFFMCPEENCNYNSVHVTHVKDHFKTHSGEQPFQCKICLMKFKYKQSCKGWFSSSSGY